MDEPERTYRVMLTIEIDVTSTSPVKAIESGALIAGLRLGKGSVSVTPTQAHCPSTGRTYGTDGSRIHRLRISERI